MHGLEHGRAANDGGEERLGDTAAKHQLRCLCELRHDVSEDASVLHLSVSRGRDMKSKIRIYSGIINTFIAVMGAGPLRNCGRAATAAMETLRNCYRAQESCFLNTRV